ncbi:hypothetical protein DKX38_005505 [Salix brachista]|uniref:DUF4408 domain-containing protein n=1 Tax=Salix brachista TaxID=2182728 RepID=A0A5N5N0N9_9ROSI|nr:hypothetical protein DKX38_005505 [Salix brachista]
MKKGNLLPPTRIHHHSHPQISALQTPPLSQIQRSKFHIPHFPTLSLSSLYIYPIPHNLSRNTSTDHHHLPFLTQTFSPLQILEIQAKVLKVSTRETNMGSLSLSLKVVLISTTVLFMFLYLKVCFTLVHDFSVNQAALLWSYLMSSLKPLYLFVIINCIIITIVVSSRFHHNTNGTSTYDQIEKIPMEDYVHDMMFRSDGALNLRALSAYQDREEVVDVEDKSMVIEDGKNEVADDSVISMSRFGHGKVVEASHEGGRAMRMAKPKRHETLENTWKMITEDRAMPFTRNVKRSKTLKDMWENHGNQFITSLMDPHAVNKSETFNDRINYQSPPIGSLAPASEKFRKEPSLSQDELNQRVEAFIDKFKEEMRMQKARSWNQYKEMNSHGGR